MAQDRAPTVASGWAVTDFRGHGIDPGVTRWANPARRAPSSQTPCGGRSGSLSPPTVAIPGHLPDLALGAGCGRGAGQLAERAPLSWSPDHREVVELTIVVGAGLVIGLACVILMGRFSYKVSREYRGAGGRGPPLRG